MKRYRLFLCILLALGYGYFVYLIVYQWTYKDLQENPLHDESALSSTTRETTSGDADPAINIVEGEEAVRVSSNMVYILESYELTSGRYTNEVLPLPIELIGMTVEELHGHYLGEEEFELVVFENNILVVRRLYEEKEPVYRFRLIAEKNKIVVYLVSTGEVFANTDIKFNDLPYGLKTEIQNGKYFESESELYYFLESYSS